MLLFSFLVFSFPVYQGLLAYRNSRNNPIHLDWRLDGLDHRGNRSGHVQQHTPHLDGHVGQVNSEIDTNLNFSLYTRANGESVAEAL